jgi:hypothetical protein
MSTLKQLKEATSHTNKSYPLSVWQHHPDGHAEKWGGGYTDIEDARKEAIDCAAHKLGTVHKMQFSVRQSNGHDIHHYAVEHRNHNGGSYVWDKKSGKTVREL